jgi:hypothetical protein
MSDLPAEKAKAAEVVERSLEEACWEPRSSVDAAPEVIGRLSALILLQADKIPYPGHAPTIVGDVVEQAAEIIRCQKVATSRGTVLPWTLDLHDEPGKAKVLERLGRMICLIVQLIDAYGLTLYDVLSHEMLARELLTRALAERERHLYAAEEEVVGETAGVE